MLRIIGTGLLALIVVTVGTGLYLADKIYLRDGHITVPDDRLDRRIPVVELREDLAVLVEVFEETHVDFAAINGRSYAAAVEDLSARIDGPMTRIEFYRLLGPLNSLLSDGHTSVLRPTEEIDRYERDGGLYLPLQVDLDAGRIRIARPFGPGPDFMPGDEILSVNDVPAAELSRAVLSYQSGETSALRNAYAERSFYRALPVLGIGSPFDIEFERNGERMFQRVEGMTRGAYRAQREGSGSGGNAFEILNQTTALLTFSEMPSQLGAFRAFLDTSFDELAANDITTLIVDIRANGGGDSRAGDLLLRYISDRDYPALERVDVKVTERIQAYYRTLLPRGFRWLPLNRFVPILRRIERSEPGSVFAVYPDGEAPEDWAASRENAFSGQVIVLTGPATYSSAALFAAPLSHFDQAIFIGAETGEPMVFFGENYVFDLPNSRLQAVVSHKRFDLVGDGDHQSGLQPDIEVEAGRALEEALAFSSDRSRRAGP